MEIWKKIENSYYYAVSNKGRIKRLAHQTWSVRNNSYSQYKERILKLSNNNSKKYWRLTIDYLDNISKAESIHRLVALNFIENPNNLPQVNHKDGNKDNNNVDNLEWCTNLYNMQHAIRTGLRDNFLLSLQGEKSNFNKYSEETLMKIPKLIEEGNSYKKIGEILNIPPTLISEIKSKRAWKHLNIIIPESKLYKKKI